MRGFFSKTCRNTEKTSGRIFETASALPVVETQISALHFLSSIVPWRLHIPWSRHRIFLWFLLKCRECLLCSFIIKNTAGKKWSARTRNTRDFRKILPPVIDSTEQIVSFLCRQCHNVFALYDVIVLSYSFSVLYFQNRHGFLCERNYFLQIRLVRLFLKPPLQFVFLFQWLRIRFENCERNFNFIFGTRIILIDNTNAMRWRNAKFLGALDLLAIRSAKPGGVSITSPVGIMAISPGAMVTFSGRKVENLPNQQCETGEEEHRNEDEKRNLHIWKIQEDCNTFEKRGKIFFVLMSEKSRRL